MGSGNDIFVDWDLFLSYTFLSSSESALILFYKFSPFYSILCLTKLLLLFLSSDSSLDLCLMCSLPADESRDCRALPLASEC